MHLASEMVNTSRTYSTGQETLHSIYGLCVEILRYIFLGKLVKALHETVSDNSSGSFQWVVLVVAIILELCRKGESGQALKSIKRIPSELSSLYEGLLLEIDEGDRLRALKLMR